MNQSQQQDPVDEAWNRQVDLITDLFQQSRDPAKSDEEQATAFNRWFEEKQRLETGHYF